MGSRDGANRFRRLKMFFDVICSGSKGNATLVFTKENIFLIDLGIPLKKLEEELALFNKTINDIDALFVTHNHADHYRNIKAISPKKQYALDGTLPSSLSNILEESCPFFINNVKITPFLVSHDATNPCGYVIEEDGVKLAYMTDTGKHLSRNTKIMKNPTYLIIESNHDIKMELKAKRTMETKQRVMSDYGHLCNEDSAFAALEIIGPDTKEIVLAHLSEEANTPEVALAAYKKIFSYAHVDINKYKVRCAMQWEHLIGGDYEN